MPPKSAPQQPLGYQAQAGWGQHPDILSDYAVGDLFYVPRGCSAILNNRVEAPGVYRVESVFSIADDASYYYRIAPCEIRRKGLRLEIITDWFRCSDRLHVLPGDTDYTAGFILLHTLKETA